MSPIFQNCRLTSFQWPIKHNLFACQAITVFVMTAEFTTMHDFNCACLRFMVKNIYVNPILNRTDSVVCPSQKQRAILVNQVAFNQANCAMTLTSNHLASTKQGMRNAIYFSSISGVVCPQETFISFIHIKCSNKPSKSFCRYHLAIQGSRHSVFKLACEFRCTVAPLPTIPEVLFQHFRHCSLAKISVITCHSSLPQAAVTRFVSEKFAQEASCSCDDLSRRPPIHHPL